jgi:tetratricopeptide (TPR) repeat protein
MNRNEKPRRQTRQEEQSISEKLNVFLQKNRKVFLFLGIGVIISLVVFAGLSLINKNTLTKSTIAYELLDTEFENWKSYDDMNKVNYISTLLESCDSVFTKFPKSYAGLRSLLIKAQALYDIKDLENAEKMYYEIFIKFPKSHLACIALTNAAACAEDREDYESALTYLLLADEKYPEEPGLDRIILSIGRLYESLMQYDDAVSVYYRLIASGLGNDWTKVAQSRLIYLRSQGIIN